MTSASTLIVDGFRFSAGGILSSAAIRYRTHGVLAPERDNCVLLFTYYTGTDSSYDPWIGVGRPLDPEKYFIVIVNHFGGSVSSSPSNTSGQFPELRLSDTVHAARAVLDELGVERIRLAAGWSLGGMQALEYAATFPSTVDAVFALCSAARCSEVNEVFLSSVSAALEADPKFAIADSADPPLRGLNAFGRVYAGWAYSEEFFSDAHYLNHGYRSAAHVLAEWGRDHESLDAHDLMAALEMWRAADLGYGRGGLAAGLGRIQARTILMPSSTDAYFTVTENRREVPQLPVGELRELRSPLGHVAGRPGIGEDEQAQVDACLRDLLRENA